MTIADNKIETRSHVEEAMFAELGREPGPAKSHRDALPQRAKKRLRGLQVGRVEALGKAIVHR